MKKLAIPTFRVLGLMMMAGVFLLTGSALAQSTQGSTKMVNFVANLSKSSVRQDSNPLITLKVDRVSLGEALKRIAGQAEAGLYYNTVLLPDKTVSVRLQAVPLGKALRKVLAGTSLRVVTSGRNITLRPKRKKDKIQLKQANKQEIINGTVTDASTGNTMPGVNIKVKGTTTGTSTDAQGQYELTVKSLQDTLAFSFVGYQTQNVPIKGRTEINIEMQSQAITGEEMVVVGYGTQKKEDLTGSIASVDNEELMESPAINVEQALSGKVAGANVATNSGRPGGRTRIAIRGFSSINASNAPLYVVDGIISPNGIQNLNPNNIESINVLKDASSTAIYGTRGSNGVIIINTKRGNENGVQVNYDGHMSINWLPKDRKLDVLNSEEFLSIEEEQYKNASKFDPVGFANGKYKDPIEKRKQYLVGNELGNRELFYLDENGIPQPLYDVDWQDMSTRTPISQSQNLSITGGDNLTSYGLFINRIIDKGIIKESFAKRNSIRAVVDRRVEDWLKMGGTFSYASMTEGGVNDNNGSYDVIRRMVEFVPFIPYKYEDGTYGTAGDYEGLERQDSPLTEIQEIKRRYNTKTFQGNAYAEFNIMKGLEFTSTFGVNTSNNTDPHFESSKLRGNRSEASIYSSEYEFWEWSNRLNYEEQIGENHNLKILAGAELQSSNFLNWTARTEDMSTDYYEWNNLSSGAIARAPSSSTSEYKLESYFARVNYNFKDKYLLTATSRIDGSSKFGTANKYAFFPSAAIAWKITEEDFLRNSEILSNLKLRASYGLTGNSNISPYRSLARLSTNSYIYNGSRISGSSVGSLANPELQWEKTREYDIGIDLGLLRNRVSITADYYLKRTHDLLLDAPVPATSGYTGVLKNIGSVENQGIDLSLKSFNVQGANFTWSTNINFSFLKNRVTALGANNEDIIYGFKDALILRVGESVGSIYGYKRDGIWGTDEKEEAAVYDLKPGDVHIRDLNQDGTINQEDRTIIGNGIPNLYGTFSNSFRYKNFDLTVALQFWEGNDVFDNARNSGEARQGIANSFATVLDAWTPENQDAILEQVRPTGAYYAYYMDERNLTDGSFIRGKNLVIGYTIPSSTSSKWGLNKLRFYASAQNFFLITKYYGYDPEVSNYDDDAFSQGMTYADYPKPRTFMLGINVSF